MSADPPSGVQGIRPNQITLVRQLLERAVAGSTFFAKRLADVDIDAITDEEAFRETVPTMAKEDVLRSVSEHPPYGDVLAVPPERVSMTHLTSGTSGLGQEVFALTEPDIERMATIWAAALASAGVQPGATVALLYPVSVLTVGRGVMELTRKGYQVIPLFGVDKEIAGGVLERFRPSVLIGRPASLALLRDAMVARGGDPGTIGLEVIITVGVTVGEWQTLQETWGARVHEIYGSTQLAAPGGITCSARDGTSPGVIHLGHDDALFEVIDPSTGAIAGDGEEGELIVTPWWREATPVIRYRSGDRVVVRGSCPCGRAWGIEQGSVGRFDDMMKIRGNKVWPSQVDEALLTRAQVADYRGGVWVDERGLDHMVLVVALADADQAGEILRTELQHAVRKTTNVRPTILFASQLPAVGLKPRRWEQSAQTLERLADLDRAQLTS